MNRLGDIVVLPYWFMAESPGSHWHPGRVIDIAGPFTKVAATKAWGTILHNVWAMSNDLSHIPHYTIYHKGQSMKSPYYQDEKSRPIIALEKKDGWNIVYVEAEDNDIALKTRKLRYMQPFETKEAADTMIAELAHKKRWVLVEATEEFPEVSEEPVDETPNETHIDDSEVVEETIVFGFMAGESEMMIVTDKGVRLFADAPGVPDAAYAREAFFNLPYEEKLGTPDYSLVWAEDPSADERIIKACSTLNTTGKDPVAEPVACAMCGCTDSSPCPTENGLCSMGEDGLCSVCSGIDKHLTDENGEPATREGTVDTETSQEPEESETQIEGDDGVIYDIIPVTVKASTSERHLRNKIRQVHEMEMEARLEAAAARNAIKAEWEEIYKMTAQDPKVMVRCRIEFDWEKDVKNWISMDDGTVQQSARLTDAERQTHLDLQPPEEPAEQLPEETPTGVEQDEGADDDGQPTQPESDPIENQEPGNTLEFPDVAGA